MNTDISKLEIRSEIFEALLTKVPEGTQMNESDQSRIKTAIEDLLSKGWDKYEVVRYLRWTEHVNPLIGEDQALANMKLVRDEVEARLSKMS